MDSIDDLTCKLSSPSSDQPTNDTLSPIYARNSDILSDIKKSLENQTKPNFPLKDYLYQNIQNMKQLSYDEQFSFQISQIIIFSEYVDNSEIKIEILKQLIQETSNLNLRTYLIQIQDNKENKSFQNSKEFKQLLDQFPISLQFSQCTLNQVPIIIRNIQNELRIGQLQNQIFVHVSTNKSMKTYLQNLFTILLKFESNLTKNDRLYWSVQKQVEKLTIEIQEIPNTKNISSNIIKQSQRKQYLYGFIALVSICVLCYILYAGIVTLI